MTVLGLARRRPTSEEPRDAGAPVPDGVIPIAEVAYRRRASIGGRVRSMRVQPWGGVATMECTLVDDTAGIVVVFLGRREIAGIRPGARMVVEGMVGVHHGRLAIVNPSYDLIASGSR